MYHWRTLIVPLPPRNTIGTTLYSVGVEISWPGPDRPRRVELDTRRLGPAPP